MRSYKIALLVAGLILALMSCAEEKTMNKKSLNKPAPESAQDQKYSSAPKAYFAGGCFWGVEYLFEKKEGVISAVSGFMGGYAEKPTYSDVVSGNTGHLEVVEVAYDPAKVTYEELAKYFFEIHDPTQVGGQGPDIGEQYISAVFYGSEEEKITVNKLIAALKSKGYKVVTQVRPAGVFWKAEEYHQDYYAKNKKQPYCHVYQKKF
jgi:peptide methionine sulfoxide reductase msrA/msrB